MGTSNDNSQNNVEKFLPENTPIAMLWFVKDPSELKDDQLPLPNNKVSETRRGYIRIKEDC